MPLNVTTAVDVLVERGLDPSESSAKHTLVGRVLARHVALAGAPPAHMLWIPGRLEVFGKHTDYAGGRTLVSPVPRGFAVAVSPRRDDTIQVADALRDDVMTTTADASKKPAGGWRNYVDVAVRRLARNFPGAPLAADITIGSDLPSASGMSSSSALIVAIAAALERVAALPSHPAWTGNIRSGLDLAGYYACIENGRDFAALSGDAGVGTHGGSEDHTAIVEGRPGHVSAFAFVPPRALGTAKLAANWRFVIAPSGVAARKTGDAREPYNRLSAAVSQLLDAWNREGPEAASLAAALQSNADATARLRALADRAGSTDAPSGWLRNRLDHFIREDARAMEALAAFADGDATTLGEISAASQADAETLLENQVPATSSLASSARTLGAFAACSFGAGSAARCGRSLRRQTPTGSREPGALAASS